MKKVLIQGVLGITQEMVELDSGLIVPAKVALDQLDQQIKKMEELRDLSLASLSANRIGAHPTIN